LIYSLFPFHALCNLFFLLVQKLLAFVDMVIDIRMATVSHKQSAARTIDCSQLVFLDLASHYALQSVFTANSLMGGGCFRCDMRFHRLAL
jgi:hypothetical protein